MKFLIAFVLFFGIACAAKLENVKVPKNLKQLLSQKQNAEFTLKMAKMVSNLFSDSDDMNCTQCQIMVDNVCSLMTNPYNYDSYLVAVAITDEFNKVFVKLNYNIQFYVDTVMNIFYPLIDQIIWPNVCQLLDSSCPKNPNVMCQGEFLPTDPPMTPTSSIPNDFPAETTTINSDDCQDSGSGCEDSFDKCGNSLYKPFMCKHCKKTCNLCNDSQCSTVD